MEIPEGTLRVWWIPQVPMEPFFVYVRNIEQAILILDALARYDSFQFENKVKPDYVNVGGLHVFEDGEWVDWYNTENEDINYILSMYYEDQNPLISYVEGEEI